MKIANILLFPVLLMFGFGCQSHRSASISRTSTVTEEVAQTPAAPAAAAVPSAPGLPTPTSVQQVVTDKATYTIEVIPSARLTPTSREGDKPSKVYSSNIIAVYVHTNNSVTVSSTNAPLMLAPDNQPQSNQ